MVIGKATTGQRYVWLCAGPQINITNNINTTTYVNRLLPARNKDTGAERMQPRRTVAATPKHRHGIDTTTNPNIICSICIDWDTPIIVNVVYVCSLERGIRKYENIQQIRNKRTVSVSSPWSETSWGVRAYRSCLIVRIINIMIEIKATGCRLWQNGGAPFIIFNFSQSKK